MTWSPDNGIYEGFWTEWSKGSVRGRTLTLGPTNATILTNSLAMFVTLCSIQTWAIIRYTLHLSGPASPRDAASPRITQQLILRNTTSALTTALLTIELIWDHRKQAWRTLIRPWTIVFWAAMYAALFTTAAVLSNKAISVKMNNGTSLVLLRSNTCGTWNQTYHNMIFSSLEETTEDFDVKSEYYEKIATEAQRSLQYVQQCYLPTTSERDASSVCRTLKSPTIGNTTAAPADCPFSKEICNNNADVVKFDTGDINTHDHLGINSPPEDRLTYRRIATCAVFNDSSHVSGWSGDIVNATSPPPQKDSAYAYYGPSYGASTNWTYSISNFASFYDNFTARVTIPYQVDVEFSPGVTDPQWTDPDFEPIPEIAQTDADVLLIFLSFTGMYLVEIDDPWFSAHSLHTFENTKPMYEKRYSRDQAISTLGCVEKHNFCTHNNVCTGFLGFDQFQNVAEFNSALSPRQNATFDRMTRALAFSSIWNAIQLLSQTTDPLMATSLIQIGKSGAVLSASMPVDQWKAEISFWQSIALAQLQRQMLLWATGDISAEPKYLVPAASEQDIWYCKNFMVPSSVYQSFSVLSVSIIIALGTLLIFTGMFIDELADAGAGWFKKTPPGTNWKNDNMLALHRRRTRARRRSFFSFKSKSHYSPSPKFEGSPHLPALPTPALNSARISSQAWPPSRHIYLSPDMSKSPEVSATQHIPVFRHREALHSPMWRPISIHEMKDVPPKVPPKAPTIRIDGSHCKCEVSYPESAPENYYKHQPNSGSPVSKVTQVLDWIKTLHHEHPAYYRGGHRSD